MLSNHSDRLFVYMTRAIKIAPFVLCLGAHHLLSQQSTFDKDEIRRYRIRKVTIQIDYGNNVRLSFTREFDRKGNLLKEVGFGSDGQPNLKQQYNYDNRDNIVEASSDGRIQRVTWVYDESGHATASRVFDGNGELQGSRTFRLNDRGKVVEDKSYDSAGQPIHVQQTSYDSLGNMVQQTERDGDGKLIGRKEHRFNQSGDAVETLTYDSNNHLSSRTSYKYGDGTDTRHLVEQTDYAPNGALQNRRTLTRDNQGFVVKELQSDANGKANTVTEFVYEFYD
jgi:hypothetical protein